jgi:hypothetical protein
VIEEERHRSQGRREGGSCATSRPAAGLTDVETTISVLDTKTETERVYMNPQETPFAPIQDTQAFATCP